MTDKKLDAGLELSNDFLSSGSYELEVFGERVPATIHLEALVKNNFKEDVKMVGFAVNTV